MRVSRSTDHLPTAEYKPIVLIVEDEPLLLLAATDMVEDAGFEAVVANNADEAVRLLESRADIRIVFTDIDMPGSMDGLKLAAAIRKRWPPIKIIVTSGYHTPEVDALPADALYFPKPYSERRVTEAMWSMAA
jgi:CheY-like chemotaxis protein